MEKVLLAGAARLTLRHLHLSRSFFLLINYQHKPVELSDFSQPEPVVIGKKPRRKFTARYKLMAFKKANACIEPGQLGVLFSQEGLYSGYQAAQARYQTPQDNAWTESWFRILQIGLATVLNRDAWPECVGILAV